MVDYLANDIVVILIVLGECYYNYRRAAELYRRRFDSKTSIIL